MTIRSNSVLRRHAAQMPPEELAQFLGDVFTPGVLTRALDIAITRIAQTALAQVDEDTDRPIWFDELKMTFPPYRL